MDNNISNNNISAGLSTDYGDRSRAEAKKKAKENKGKGASSSSSSAAAAHKDPVSQTSGPKNILQIQKILKKRPSTHSHSAAEEEVFGKPPAENKNKKQTQRKQQHNRQAEQEQPHQQQHPHNLVRKKNTSLPKNTSDTQQQQQPKVNNNPSNSSSQQNTERRKSTYSTSKDASDTQQQQQQPQQQQKQSTKVSSNPNYGSPQQNTGRKSTSSLSDAESMTFSGHREKFLTALHLKAQKREQRNQEQKAEQARLGFSPSDMSNAPRGKHLFGRDDIQMQASGCMEGIDLPKSSDEDTGVGKINLQRFKVEKEEILQESAKKRRKTEKKREPGEEKAPPPAAPHPDLRRPSHPGTSGSGSITASSKRKDSAKPPGTAELNEQTVPSNDKSGPGEGTSTFDGPPPPDSPSSCSSYVFNEYEEPGHIDPNHPNNYNKRGKKSKDRRYSTTGVSERYISQRAVKSLLRKAGIERAEHTTHFDVCEIVDRLVENIVTNMNIIIGNRSSRVRARDILFLCHEVHGMPE